jgi:hypothetical protein
MEEEEKEQEEDEEEEEEEQEQEQEEQEEQEEEFKTTSFQIPTYSLVVIFPSNVEHTISATGHASLMSEFCNFCNTTYSVLLTESFSLQFEFTGRHYETHKHSAKKPC